MSLTLPEKFKNMKAFYDRMIGLLLKDFPQVFEPFDDAVSDAHIETTKTLTHKIKGAAGNLDLAGVYESAAAFEASLRAGAPDRAHYDKFVAACEALRADPAVT